nr:class I tRNA ligase family protein [Gammaproteobacteria bacterium]
VIKNNKNNDWDYSEAAYTEQGTLIHSDAYDDLTSNKAIKAIFTDLEAKKLATKQINYRLRDWGISRQRYWGTPIPIINCKHCGEVAVPEQDLPVVLPENLIPDGQGSPLAKDTDFIKTKCPQCGKAAKRETDTMDTFVESSWYYTRYCCFDQNNSMLDDRAKYWTPVDQYIGGVEHAILHLLYARFMHKVLRDLDLVNSNEPIKRLLTQGMVLKNGAKMSKSKGNTVAPKAFLNKYGADTIRLFIIFAAPPEQSLEWSDQGVEGAFKFLNKLWNFCQKVKTNVVTLNQENATFKTYEDEALQKIHLEIHSILHQASQDIERIQLNTVVSAAMKLLNVISKIDLSLDETAPLVQEGLRILLLILSPITPHITHHLWNTLEYSGNILDVQWPKVNARALQCSTVEIIVQVNGKLRGKLSVTQDTMEEDIKTKALSLENVQRLIEGKTIRKTILVPKKLINLVV